MHGLCSHHRFMPLIASSFVYIKKNVDCYKIQSGPVIARCSFSPQSNIITSMVQWLHPTLQSRCDYFSMLLLNLIHVSQSGTRYVSSTQRLILLYICYFTPLYIFMLYIIVLRATAQIWLCQMKCNFLWNYEVSERWEPIRSCWNGLAIARNYDFVEAYGQGIGPLGNHLRYLDSHHKAGTVERQSHLNNEVPTLVRQNLYIEKNPDISRIIQFIWCNIHLSCWY